jgi:hypothetical protein
VVVFLKRLLFPRRKTTTSLRAAAASRCERRPFDFQSIHDRSGGGKDGDPDPKDSRICGETSFRGRRHHHFFCSLSLSREKWWHDASSSSLFSSSSFLSSSLSLLLVVVFHRTTPLLSSVSLLSFDARVTCSNGEKMNWKM